MDRRQRSLPITPFVCTLSTLLLIILGCARKQDEPSQRQGNTKATSPTGHEQMLNLLADIREKTPKEHPYIGTFESNRIKQVLSNTSATVPPPVRWLQSFRLAQIDLQQGQEQQSIQRFIQCLELTGEIVADKSKQTEAELKVLFELGIAYLRYGETQNCCKRNHPESCILPISGGGVHENRKGSEEAIKCFTHILKLTTPKDDLHLKSRWLLNIAWMTLGEYPDSVPEAYLIPSDAFESAVSIQKFTNIAQRMQIDTFNNCGGVIIEDFNGDHHLDLVVSSWDPRDPLKVFFSVGDGTFRDASDDCGLNGICGGLNMVQADYDNDGDTDIFIMRGAWLGLFGKQPNSLLRNNGDETFTDVTLDVGMTEHYPTQTAAWADFDNDGDLDLFIGNESDDQLSAPCQLYRNDGNSFVDVAVQAGVADGGFVKGVTWGDFDGDRFPDLYVSNQGGKNRLFQNQRDGTFKEMAKQAGVDGPSMSFPTWFWDFDNDGNLDIYVSVYAASIGDLAAFHVGLEPKAERSCLFRGDGKGNFENVTMERGLSRPDATMGANFGDLDNDGYLDFYLGTGYPKYDSLMPSVMYLNRAGKEFTDVTSAGGFGNLQKGHAVAFADLDHDGDQDVFEQMGGAFPGDRFHDALYENPGLGNHWVTLKLEGTKSNRSAIGARICVEIKEEDSTRKIYRHVNSGGSFGSSPLTQTIGLGKATSIQTLEIFWPTTGETQIFSGVNMERYYRVVEGKDELVPVDVTPFQLGGDKKVD